MTKLSQRSSSAFLKNQQKFTNWTRKERPECMPLDDAWPQTPVLGPWTTSGNPGKRNKQPFEQNGGEYESKNHSYIRHTTFGEWDKKLNICTASNWLSLPFNHFNSLRGRFIVIQFRHNSLDTGFP